MPSAATKRYNRSVFINCPFDEDYRPLFEAIIFAVQIAGYQPRCAREVINAGEVRLEKLLRIISRCRLGIHDVSRTELNRHGLPRFNMPLELGLDLACRHFGQRRHRRKSLLVMDRTPFRFQRFISDIAGQDITPHGNSQRRVIRSVRDWLATFDSSIPGGIHMYSRFRSFRRAIPRICELEQLHPNELSFGDFTKIIRIFLEETA